MTRTKLFAIVLTTALVCAAAVHAQQLKTLVTYTTGSGSATESDREQALDEAAQNAQNWANAACVGSVTNTNTISSTCFKTGSEENGNVAYTCMATVKARCETQYRAR